VGIPHVNVKGGVRLGLHAESIADSLNPHLHVVRRVDAATAEGSLPKTARLDDRGERLGIVAHKKRLLEQMVQVPPPDIDAYGYLEGVPQRPMALRT
jgi:hypothetical protein